MAVERQPAARSDAEIDYDVRETLRWDIRIDDTVIDVAVVDGKVRLMGSVNTLSEKLAAGEDVARIKGVREVSNEIFVQPQVLRRDEDIASDVIQALSRDKRLDSRQINVAVEDGIVRLTGTVYTVAQQRAAAEDAWYTAGIVDLVNELRVVPLQRRPDAAIAGDVRAALALSGHILDPTRIDVSADHGMLYLRGSVENEMERYTAEEAARLISGVTAVINELVIMPYRLSA